MLFSTFLIKNIHKVEKGTFTTSPYELISHNR